MPVRYLAYRWHLFLIYYWADAKLYELGAVNVMPALYYRILSQLSMRLAGSKRLMRLAYKAIHTIPYRVRFEVA